MKKRQRMSSLPDKKLIDYFIAAVGVEIGAGTKST